MTVMIDFESAFEKLPHLTLLQCMKIGVGAKMLQFIVRFLENCEIRVNWRKSEGGCMENGIPQESVFSPTLFNTLLYDINSNLINTV